jgi:hypothetical protein
MADLTPYLSVLRGETRKAIASGVSITLSAPSRKPNGAAGPNERNVIEAYKELEWE